MPILFIYDYFIFKFRYNKFWNLVCINKNLLSISKNNIIKYEFCRHCLINLVSGNKKVQHVSLFRIMFHLIEDLLLY